MVLHAPAGSRDVGARSDGAASIQGEDETASYVTVDALFWRGIEEYHPTRVNTSDAK